MLEILPDHDPIALRGRALSAERKGDLDTARVFRAAGSEIERLREALREIADVQHDKHDPDMGLSFAKMIANQILSQSSEGE